MLNNRHADDCQKDRQTDGTRTLLLLQRSFRHEHRKIFLVPYCYCYDYKRLRAHIHKYIHEHTHTDKDTQAHAPPFARAHTHTHTHLDRCLLSSVMLQPKQPPRPACRGGREEGRKGEIESNKQLRKTTEGRTTNKIQ